ncbi:hypothetical protein EYZ11_002247 [Aspergillus tanneri]|uniref:feruloyl esterase n=1 Tax=Aspergillus tanneri TaxID=1220188 RepID=A0A4S3JRM2_9EURO|nr:hypothetical protein EYZ11_002247 [Aspergillus tanneri]
MYVDDAVSSDDLANFRLFAQYSAAAYCDNNNNNNNNTVTGNIHCLEGVCPVVEAAKPRTIAKFSKDDIRGFVAVDDTHRLLVVSFRGTNSVRNWLKNFRFWKVEMPGPSGISGSEFEADKPQRGNDFCTCAIHAGFYESWQLVKAEVLDAVTQARETYKDYKVVLTGHSLGGAIATIAGSHLRTMDIPCDIYSYGAPRIGDLRFAEFVSNQPGWTVRITHGYDPVPTMPPMSLFGVYDLGYRHIWPEYWISDSPTEGNETIQVCRGLENFSCDGAREAKFKLEIEDHRHYLGEISACGPKFSYRDLEETWSAEDLRRLDNLAINDILFANHFISDRDGA